MMFIIHLLQIKDSVLKLKISFPVPLAELGVNEYVEIEKRMTH